MASANIFQQYLRPVRSVAEYTADFDRQEANALELAAARQKSADAGQARADDQAMRQAYQQSGGDTKAYRNALVQAGNYRAVQALDAADLERQKNAAEVGLKTAQTGKAVQETAAGQQTQKFEAAKQHAQELAAVNTPQDVLAYIQSGIQKGVFPQMSPEQIQQKLAQFPSVEAFKQQSMQASIPVLDRLKIEAENERNRLTNQTSRENNTATNATSRQNNQATVGATIRGQNLTDARSREATQATMSKPFEVTGADGAPVLVQQSKDGTIRPVSGYAPKGGDKPLNDTQSKALLFGTRMQEAEKVLQALEKGGTTTSIPGARAGGGVGAAINFFSPATQQQLNQAKRDFLNAVLRRESGAVIADSEFDSGDKQYFPQQGDSKEVIAQKSRNRRLATELILREVPEKQRGTSRGGGASGSFDAPAEAGGGKVVDFGSLK